MVEWVLRGGTEREGRRDWSGRWSQVRGDEWWGEEGEGGWVTRDTKWKAELQQSLPDRNQF